MVGYIVLVYFLWLVFVGECVVVVDYVVDGVCVSGYGLC